MEVQLDTHIYFILDETRNLIKIGVSVNVNARLAQYRMASPSTFRLVGTMDDAPGRERKLHEMYAEYRVSGEWFYPGERLVKLLRKFYGVDIPATNAPPAQLFIDDGMPMTLSEIAKLTGLKQPTLRVYCQNGELPARQVGTAWVVRRTDYEAWLARRSSNPKVRPIK